VTWASRLRAFCAAEPPAVSAEPHLVHVTTAVTLKGWRGRVYFAPVRLLHDAVTRSMMTAAARRLAT
jgi:uncharacterized protein DUF2867